MDDRRAQVAERPLRLGDRLLQASRLTPRGDDDRRLVPDPGRGRAAGARPGRLGAGVLPPRPRLLRSTPRSARSAAAALVELVERCCDGATRFAERIVELDGVELLNEVVLNQVLFRFESDERTDEVLARVQESGRIWLSGTTWDGRKAIRVSVSNWQTGDEEIDLAVEAFADYAAASRRPGRAGPRASARRSPPARSRCRSARRGRRPSRSLRARAGRRGPRSRRCRSPAARTGSRRARRPTRRARSRRLHRGQCVRVPGVARVVPVEAGRARALEQRPHLTRRGDADRVGEDDLGPSKRPASSATRPGSTRPSNGQPKATLIVTVAGTCAAARIWSTRATASSSEALPLCG